ncbi:MAG: Hint domain-containing protein [Pseudodonghicola sp.]
MATIEGSTDSATRCGIDRTRVAGGRIGGVTGGLTHGTCCASGTRILTRGGEIAVETLQVGFDVLTLGNGYQRLRWVGAQRLCAADLAAQPHLRPIRIRAGALGLGQPDTDLIVSPQLRVLVRSEVAERMFGRAEVLVAAKQLLAPDGVEVAEDLAEVTYWHLRFDAPQVVFSNGALTESLPTGADAPEALTPRAGGEMFQILPGLVRKVAERLARYGKLPVA